MEVWQIVGLALIVAIIGSVLKEVKRNEIALQLTILTGTIIFVAVLDKIKIIVDLLQSLADQANISSYYLFIVLKIVGIAYLAEFAADICRDADQKALATKIELAAKVGVLVLAMPIIVAILESIKRLVP
ncbi:stage III sporulation protein AD [Desulfitobacterium sp.]|uniref:stage III sporulation protein AD n=1 Tax=Desulfitobacterium sp. TaxID=49981 RepID=UPI002B1EF7DB|nr:stage III sporulation protein AD [Desulfitobacterium sp.]MEA4903081.1 stage III sporulation protein AD [Desulfitobacterium sp.]